MGRPCSVCAHPRRAEIDERLSAGVSLDDVVAAFSPPSRSALQRHRAGHLGRAVTFHLPPAASTASPPVQRVARLDASAELERLFTRSTAGAGRSLQDFARLTIDGLAHVYAAANATGDLGVAVRALRELRALLQFHALVPPERLEMHPGWEREPDPPDPLVHMLAWLTAPMSETPDAVEVEALAALSGTAPALAAALRERRPSFQ